jgi:hypothetical protein
LFRAFLSIWIDNDCSILTLGFDLSVIKFPLIFIAFCMSDSLLFSSSYFLWSSNSYFLNSCYFFINYSFWFLSSSSWNFISMSFLFICSIWFFNSSLDIFSSTFSKASFYNCSSTVKSDSSNFLEFGFKSLFIESFFIQFSRAAFWSFWNFFWNCSYFFLTSLWNLLMIASLGNDYKAFLA